MNLIWFRSDLRVTDNPALTAAIEKHTDKVTAVFVLCEKQWLQHKWGANKIGFVLANLMQLQEELAALNINLQLLQCDYFKQVPQLLTTYARKHHCQGLFYNQEYELNEHKRDVKVEALFKENKIPCHKFAEQCLLPPGILLNKQQAPYTVFTPFKKAYYTLLERNKFVVLSKPKRLAPLNYTNEQHSLPRELHKYLSNPILHLWQPGAKPAQKILRGFCEQDLLHYKQQRDFPSLDATSKLSAYLAVGAISIKQCFVAAVQANDLIFPGGNPNIMCWIDELIWRDFYRNIIVHHPRICKGENFNQKYDHLKWSAQTDKFQQWAIGKTGIPIIDAAMRQLVQTGWMHNRLRMITAMFLTKQLLIDWRRGEEFFSQHLVDLDFASNNGGWQWCASTGTDAVPYFRIFNPVTQSAKFDPQGVFIRKYCPELKHLDNKTIHNPSVALSATDLAKLKYPPQIIDLQVARLQALEAFKGC